MRDAVDGAERPRVAALEWLDPVFIGGHWVPQMIEMAGGDDLLGLPGEKSRTADWAEVEASQPDVVVSMPCGYDTARAAEETAAMAGRLEPLGAARVRRGRLLVLLAARAAAGRRDRAARAPPASRARARAARGPVRACAWIAGVGAKRAERQIVVDAAPQECFDALVDFGSYPEWQSAVKDCEVQSRDDDGRGRRVAFNIDAKVKTVNYTLDYSYEEPHLLSWRYVEGDVKDVDGEFTLEDQGDGTTLATYSLRLDAGVWLPGPVASMLTDTRDAALGGGPQGARRGAGLTRTVLILHSSADLYGSDRQLLAIVRGLDPAALARGVRAARRGARSPSGWRRRGPRW